jgi:hypothetical protein
MADTQCFRNLKKGSKGLQKAEQDVDQGRQAHSYPDSVIPAE